MAKSKELAAAQAAVEAAPQQPETLFNMVAYMRALATMEDIAPALESAFLEECRHALTATRAKIDAVYHVMVQFAEQAYRASGELERLQALHAEEQERIRARAARYERKLDALRAMVLEVMVMRGVYVKDKPAPLEGFTATFQANKLADQISEEGWEESLIPNEYKRAKLEWSGSAADLKALEVEFGDPTSDRYGHRAGMHYAVYKGGAKLTWSVDRKALLAALKQPCAECKGYADIKPHCPVCGGSGTVKIPGAKISTGRLALVVK